MTERIISCALTVANELGAGYLEKVYENSLALELAAAGLSVRQQEPLEVKYRGAPVGFYFADVFVENSVIIQLKTVRELTDAHKAQCINYLKGTGPRVCLLVNFAKPKIETKRIVRNF